MKKSSLLPLQRLLSHHIRQHGPIATARVSSAQARGAAGKYPYWGAVRYEIRLTRDGAPSNTALERASSDRRSERLVEQDCAALCEREGRVRCGTIGRLSEVDCRSILLELGYTVQIGRHDARQSSETRCLTLPQRLLIHLARKAGVQVSPADISSLTRVSDRWVRYQWSDHYVPYGDERDAAAFAAEGNQERRRRICQSCGDRVLPPARRELIQHDDYGQLWRIETDDPRTYSGVRVDQQVRVICPSTGAVYWLPISLRCTTAREAVASTFGLSATEYQPVIER